MSNIKKIRQEIERLQKELDDHTYYLDSREAASGYELALDDLLDFIDSLPDEEPVSEELNEAAGKRLRGVCNLAEETKEDRPLEERLQELKEIREKKDLDEAELMPDEEPSNELEKEIERYFYYEYTDNTPNEAIARHFAEWGARHGINWGDVQLLDTCILELAREEKDGADWGDSEKFYTEVLRRFYEFNDKKIPEIVAEWEKKQKPDYSGLTNVERAIHRGFLCAGVKNVSVNIIKETAQDVLANMWKPTELQMNELQHVVYGGFFITSVLESLYKDLKKL